MFSVNKKLNMKDFETDIVSKYNLKHPERQLGIGEIMKTIIIVPWNVDRNQKLNNGNFSAADNKKVISDLDVYDEPYMAYYLELITKNLLSFL